MKRVTFILTLIALLLWCFSVSAADVDKERNNTLSLNQTLQEILKAHGVNDIKSIDCSKVTDKQMEDLGDKLMDVIHTDYSEHEFMDRMMGGEKSPTLASMNRIMGARYLGCYKGEVPFGGMMGPLSGGKGYGDDYCGRRWPHMMYGNGPWGMMDGYGGGIMWILFLVIIVLVVFFVMKWAKPVGAGEAPLDILKRRYARGELTKEEFDQKKKDLDL